jgi:DNA topoisomerase-1
MTKTLVIVESPGKIAKIGQYLGADYIVKASFGHVQDLDKTTLSIDVENNFKPYYIISPDKTKVVKELKSLVKECSDVILAADGDREGEAIAYSLASVLELKNPKRIIFHEITKNALTKAVQSPTVINYDMVHAQQARRLLDRLVGYQISPVLWKYMVYNGTAQSAGRVQSVVVRIIIDKENEITKSISEPYFKTTAEFEFQEDEKSDKIKLNSSLNIGTKLYQFESEESAKQFMSLVNKKTDFKVVLVDNKKSIRKPSAPFITSSLQQEASTKLHFSVKKTMDVAQKLYEAGLITYMRSDSPNISKEAIKEAEVYITKTYGKEYSDSKNYESKSSNSQDAHECIRPTHIDKPEPENIDGDQAKLYSLIWKRTMASQMANAQINIQTIQIDCINNKSSILIFNNTQAYFTSTLENVEFPGYLIVYDNSPEDEEKTSGKLAIKPKDKLNLNKLKVCEEYTKPPLRYNEAALVKYLEKNGIGRPSTYASIISKVIERQYVEIKNIDGVKKQSKQFELDSKFKIKESVKEISIGKETKKLVPTHLGNQINDFMMKYFEQIMDIEFTANFETYLDKIAEGKANWVTVLKTFYELFNPIVEKLNSQAKEKVKKIGSSTDKLLGTSSSGLEVYAGSGKYGPYVKIKDDDDKLKYAPLKDIKLDDVTIDDAITLLEYPKTLGKVGNAIVTLNKGQYGLYLKYAGKNISIKETDLTKINIEYAKTIIDAGDPYALKTFKVKDKILNIKKGEYGPYIQIDSKNKKQFVSIPASYSIENINIDDVLKIIASKNGTSKTKN